MRDGHTVRVWNAISPKRERERHLVEYIAADECRMAAGGSRLSLACRVELMNYDRNSAVLINRPMSSTDFDAT